MPAPTVDGDIYKGLHPVVQEELRKAREFRENVETQQLTEVAKKYALLGKKPEELVPVLKSLKAAGGSAYDDMIGLLDSNLAAVEKSGVFSEIGKRGSEGQLRRQCLGQDRGRCAGDHQVQARHALGRRC